MSKPFFTRARLFLFILTLSIGAVGYWGYQNYTLLQYKLVLEKELGESFEKANGLLREELGKTRIERDDLKQKLDAEKIRLDIVALQVQDLEGVVGKLEKLKKIDQELLKKYSKVYFLNENYVPSKLTQIDPKYTHDPKKGLLIHGDVAPFLQLLMEAAARENIDIRVISAYRSFGAQAEIKSTYTIVYGSGANKFSADQGYSEHQLGTTADFTTSKSGANFSAFAKTEAYRWLADSAYKYGFTLSYPENNAYYRYEPWHWRFVGRNLASKLHLEKRSFYDLDQREIDAFLISLFD